MAEMNDIPDFEAMAALIKKDALDAAEVIGENFFKEGFEKGGFTDAAFEKWEDTKGSLDGYKVLQRTGALRDSVKAQERTENTIAFGSDEKYAQIHNEGGVIDITDAMRKFFWRMYRLSGKEKWKWMALSKNKKIEIHQRKFVGESQTLMAELDDWAVNYIQKLRNEK